MQSLNFQQFLSRLLNKEIDQDTEFKLSSAQRARVIAWTKTNGIKLSDVSLKGSLSIRMLENSESPNVNSLSTSTEEPIILNGTHSKDMRVGIDIQQISEIFPEGLPNDPKTSEELSKIFSLAELSYAQACVKPTETLAGIFAAKEAVIKAGGDRDLHDVEIKPDSTGAPQTKGYALSISHSGGYAIAIAVANGEAPMVSAVPAPASIFPEHFNIALPPPARRNWGRIFLDIFLLVSISTVFVMLLLK